MQWPNEADDTIYSFPTSVALDVFYTTFKGYTGVFPQWKENSENSRNLTNCLSMNRGQFKDPVSHMCLAGDVVASCSLTQEVPGMSPFTVITNIFSH